MRAAFAVKDNHQQKNYTKKGSYDPANNFVTAACNGDIKTIRHLIHKKDVVAPELVSIPASRTYVTPLQMALYYQHTDIALLLLNNNKLLPDHCTDSFCKGLLDAKLNAQHQVATVRDRLEEKEEELQRLGALYNASQNLVAQQRASLDSELETTNHQRAEIESLTKRLADALDQQQQQQQANIFRAQTPTPSTTPPADPSTGPIDDELKELRAQLAEMHATKDAFVANTHKQIESAVQQRIDVQRQLDLALKQLDAITGEKKRETLAQQAWIITEKGNELQIDPVANLSQNANLISDVHVTQCMKHHCDWITQIDHFKDYVHRFARQNSEMVSHTKNLVMNVKGRSLWIPPTASSATSGTVQAPLGPDFRDRYGLRVDVESFLPTTPTPHVERLGSLIEDLQRMLGQPELSPFQGMIQSQHTKLQTIKTLLNANNMHETRYIDIITTLVEYFKSILTSQPLDIVLSASHKKATELEGSISKSAVQKVGRESAGSPFGAARHAEDQLTKSAELLTLLHNQLLVARQRYEEVDVEDALATIEAESIAKIEMLQADVLALHTDCRNDALACEQILQEQHETRQVGSSGLHDSIVSMLEQELPKNDFDITSCWQQVTTALENLTLACQHRYNVMKDAVQGLMERKREDSTGDVVAVQLRHNIEKLSVLGQRCDVAVTVFNSIMDLVQDGSLQLRQFFRECKDYAQQSVHGLNKDLETKLTSWNELYTDTLDHHQRQLQFINSRIDVLKGHMSSSNGQPGFPQMGTNLVNTFQQLAAERDWLEKEIPKLQNERIQLTRNLSSTTPTNLFNQSPSEESVSHTPTPPVGPQPKRMSTSRPTSAGEKRVHFNSSTQRAANVQQQQPHTNAVHSPLPLSASPSKTKHVAMPPTSPTPDSGDSANMSAELKYNRNLKFALVQIGIALPPLYLDAITGEIMADPVVASDGHTYDRSSIESWMRKCRTSPVTFDPFPSAVLKPNTVLCGKIGQWRKEQAKSIGFPPLNSQEC
eukprot:TRINITY_DN46051_c0_g1_i1.p1 TRINITY_DN46051_c0_g1~~TRINITY_DN46051_c0_g1_i1.p1  ORF type:complete len:1001 (-),score=83.28 TRINITY_DN46051_c0_g1_i1:152-3154(-)